MQQKNQKKNQKKNLPIVAWRWRILFSSSELCEEDDGSTSETPESAGLGGSDPKKTKNIKIKTIQSLDNFRLIWGKLIGSFIFFD